ncbi:MAG TPA: response regulator, partial [Gammaproteobacteria bacterium]|nr:response regulator [Gammaproteobacteria bacterium]
MRLLYVEDDPRLARNVKRGLEEEGFAVDISVDGQDGLFMALNCPYDVVILDRMLPKMEGLEVLATMRKKGNKTPVLILTALGETDEKISGLDTGADDYLGKPFA